MAQAGLHNLVGMALRKVAPGRKWLMTGILLGSMLPDADNLVVAVATVAKIPTAGLHRTFTHSLFTIAAIILLFYLAARITRRSAWINLGIGLGAGILLHVLLDLLIWFNGVAILWPIPSWINLWTGIAPASWFDKLMQSAEFLFFALFFISLELLARKQGTDREFWGRLRVWTWIEAGLFVIFTVMIYTLQNGFMTPYGLVYLLSLGLAVGVTLRMRNTVETTAA